MIEITSTGWTADWLVGWLASVGVIYRNRGIRLHWDLEMGDQAVFTVASSEELKATMPTVEDAGALSITRHVDGEPEFDRNPSRDAWGRRAQLARERGDLSLGATVSDLGIKPADRLEHSPFDASVPRGVTLWERLLSSIEEAEQLSSSDGLSLMTSLEGNGRVSTRNGLGFDLRRLGAISVPGAGLLVDPWAESLAFYGLLAFTQSGTDTRGWRDGSMFRDGAFRWPTWQRPLDWPAVDALLDRFYVDESSMEVSGVFGSTAYRPTASMDSTRGYDGVRVR